MEKLTDFAQKVLDFIQPDVLKQDEYIIPRELAAVCQSEEMRTFVTRITQAVQQKEKVMVAGDYDADGVLSSVIMVSGLRSLGLDVGFYIPDRIREGYGLKPKTVQQAYEKGYTLMITVDNGVSAKAAVQKARELGMDLIITDHHIYDERPDVLALVHPALMEEAFSTLCGAGVAYECMRALEADTEKHLMFAATASIADCMEVTGETRAIIQKGLSLLNDKGEMHLCALTKDAVCTESTVAFQIAPRINCVGRLADMGNVNNLVRYFLCEDPGKVYPFAATIDDLNNTRKKKTESVVAKANAVCKITRPVLVIKDDSFHEGIIGLAAGQLCTQYGKPVIIGTLGNEGVKCSMRAPKGFHCLEFLEKFDGFTAIGGHALAAGFTVPFDKWEDFEKFAFQEGLKTGFQPQPTRALPIRPEEATVENIESLDALRPFGTGFELPRFELDHPTISRIFDLSSGRHRKFMFPGGLNALNFNQTPQDAAASVLTIQKMIGTLEINRYQGRKSPSFLIDEIIYF